MNTGRRLAAVEARLRAVEDEQEIQRLLNRYGPLADSGSGTEATALWTDGGTYEFETDAGIDGRVAPDEIAAIYTAAFHQQLIATGSSHLTVAPVISLNGDVAEAVGYSFVIVRDVEGWQIRRAAVNHWTLVRSAAGWRISRRANRLLTGSVGSREMLGRARS